MTGFNYKEIDVIIHSRIRLSIVSVLMSVEEAEFTFLRKKIGTTDGNLSVHLKKLEDAGYINVSKNFVDRKPVSRYKLNKKGQDAFKAYIEQFEKLTKT